MPSWYSAFLGGLLTQGCAPPCWLGCHSNLAITQFCSLLGIKDQVLTPISPAHRARIIDGGPLGVTETPCQQSTGIKGHLDRFGEDPWGHSNGVNMPTGASRLTGLGVPLQSPTPLSLLFCELGATCKPVAIRQHEHCVSWNGCAIVVFPRPLLSLGFRFL